jgi:hypothetical protein
MDYTCINPNICEINSDSLSELLGVGWADGNFGKSTEETSNSKPPLFMFLIPCMFLQSIYFPTTALHDTIYMIHTKTPTFQHPGAIFRKLMLQRCNSQPTDLFFVHIYKPN